MFVIAVSHIKIIISVFADSGVMDRDWDKNKLVQATISRKFEKKNIVYCIGDL